MGVQQGAYGIGQTIFKRPGVGRVSGLSGLDKKIYLAIGRSIAYLSIYLFIQQGKTTHA
jgi:hypothetical protein